MRRIDKKSLHRAVKRTDVAIPSRFNYLRSITSTYLRIARQSLQDAGLLRVCLEFCEVAHFSQCLQTAVPIGGATMRFNIGVEITDAPAMRGLALQRHLAQGNSEADFIAAEAVLWPDQPGAYWLTVIADSLGSGRGFRFVRTHQE